MPASTALVIWGYFCVAIFGSAINAKVLGPTVAFCVGLLFVSSFEGAMGLATGMFLLYVVSWVVAGFRD
jgi:hypothetical protein